MRLLLRRILYMTFFIMFFVIAPLLAMYTAGYSYNFKSNKIEKTGIISLDSIPKKAQVFVDGKYKDKTPARSTRVLPGKYYVEVKMDERYSWQSEMEVKSNLTTFNKNIVLFKKSLPTIRIEGDFNILTTSLDGEKIIYSVVKENIEELRLLNLRSNSDFLVEEFNRKTYNDIEFIQWSPSQNKALIKQVIGDFNKYLIIDIETLKIKEVFSITRLNFSKVKWEKNNDNNLYGLRKKVLYKIDLIKNTAEPIISDHITDFEVEDDNIYYTTSIGLETFLNKKYQDIEESKKIKLPSPSDYVLQRSPIGLLALLDERKQEIFVVANDIFEKDNIENEILLQAQAKNIIWSKDNSKIIYYTDFELSSYDFNKQQRELINRFSQVIEKVIWYPEEHYIIYQTADCIKATEIKNQGNLNDITLVELEEINNTTMDSRGENLFFQGKIGSQEGMFQLNIN